MHLGNVLTGGGEEGMGGDSHHNGAFEAMSIQHQPPHITQVICDPHLLHMLHANLHHMTTCFFPAQQDLSSKHQIYFHKSITLPKRDCSTYSFYRLNLIFCIEMGCGYFLVCKRPKFKILSPGFCPQPSTHG